MEVEVKLRLPDSTNFARLNSILSPFHHKTLNQQNLFFDSDSAALSSKRAVLRCRFYNEDSRCVLSLKAKPVLINGVSRVEEDEEDIDPSIGRECVADPSKLSSIESRILNRCREEYGIGGEVMKFVCLGGFENVREVYEWRGLELEVDETKYSFGVCYELECETTDPDRVKKELEEFLKESGIDYSYSEMSKFAVFRSGKLPLRWSRDINMGYKEACSCSSNFNMVIFKGYNGLEQQDGVLYRIKQSLEQQHQYCFLYQGEQG